MKIQKQLLRIFPAPLKRMFQNRAEKQKMFEIPPINCDPTCLRFVDNDVLKKLLTNHEIEIEWKELKKRIDPTFDIPDMTGGVNFGDRKAIYFLIREFKPSSVLEIGTHIGASTLHIASALFENKIKDGKSANLVSVDIADVNDPVSKPWLKYGTNYSPIEMINKMNFEHFVEFVSDTSLHYLNNCEQKFDFIFLDGDHSAKMVYKEIPIALKFLKKNGIILLHDYFPNLKPLWSNGSVIPGPFLAVERFRAEGAKLVGLPLGELPWSTKLSSKITSLALLQIANQ